MVTVKSTIRLLMRVISNAVQKHPATAALNIPLISLIVQSKAEPPVTGESSEKIQKSQIYFKNKPISEIVQEADDLFERGRFLEVYELLNKLKFSNNAEVQWRISRALFKLSKDESVSGELRREMIREAYEIIHSTVGLDENNANVWKWLAIISDAQNSFAGLEERVRYYGEVKQYLQRAVELNPQDAVSFYILGKWCFEISKLTFLQRIIVRVLYGSIPLATSEETYEYLLKSYEIDPNLYYIPTMYMLGETCIRLNMFFRARYYLNAAATLPSRTECENRCAEKAKRLLKRLDHYDLTRASLDIPPL